LILPPKLDDSCVLWLDFASVKNNTVYDQSKYHNDGKVYGAQHIGRFGLHGLSFDGVDDYVQLTNSITLSKEGFTILAFVNLAGWLGTHYNEMYNIVSNGNKYISYFGFSNQNSERRIQGETDTNNEYFVRKSYVVETGKNVFTGVVVNENGAKAIWNNNIYDATAIWPLTDNLTISQISNSVSETSWYGNIYFVALYNRALSDAEIRELYYYLTKGIRSIVPSRFVARKVG